MAWLAPHIIHQQEDLRSLQLGTLVFGSELCYEAGGDTDPCTYLFHELPADASEEVQTEVEEGVWRELFIGRILQEGSAAGMGMPLVAFKVESSGEPTVENPLNLNGYLVRYPHCPTTLFKWFEPENPKHRRKLQRFIKSVFRTAKQTGINPRHTDFLERVLVTSSEELLLIDFSHAVIMNNVSGHPGGFVKCKPIRDPDFHLAPEQRVDPEEGVAAGTTEESMQTLVFSLGFMEGFLLSRGKICMNLLDASWEQDSNADIDFTKLLDDHFVAERLTMCLRHDPNKRLTPEGWFGHLSMWRDNADKMKTTMELLAWCVKGLPEFEKFAQEVLGPMLDKGRFEMVHHHLVILGMRLKRPEFGDAYLENRTWLYNRFFTRFKEMILGFRYMLGHFDDKYPSLEWPVLMPYMPAPEPGVSREQRCAIAFHRYLISNKARSMYLLMINKAAFDCGIDRVRAAFCVQLDEEEDDGQQLLSSGRPESSLMSIEALLLLMDWRWPLAEAQGCGSSPVKGQSSRSSIQQATSTLHAAVVADAAVAANSTSLATSATAAAAAATSAVATALEEIAPTAAAAAAAAEPSVCDGDATSRVTGIPGGSSSAKVLLDGTISAPAASGANAGKDRFAAASINAVPVVRGEYAAAEPGGTHSVPQLPNGLSTLTATTAGHVATGCSAGTTASPSVVTAAPAELPTSVGSGSVGDSIGNNTSSNDLQQGAVDKPGALSTAATKVHKTTTRADTPPNVSHPSAVVSRPTRADAMSAASVGPLVVTAAGPLLDAATSVMPAAAGNGSGSDNGSSNSRVKQCGATDTNRAATSKAAAEIGRPAVAAGSVLTCPYAGTAAGPSLAAVAPAGLATSVTNHSRAFADESSANGSDAKSSLADQKATTATCGAAGVSKSSAPPAAPAPVGHVLASFSSSGAAVSRSSSNPAAVLCALAAAISDTPTAAPQPLIGVMAASGPCHQPVTAVLPAEASVTAVGSTASVVVVVAPAAVGGGHGGDDHLDQQQQHAAGRSVAVEGEGSGSGDGTRASQDEAVLRGSTTNNPQLVSAATATAPEVTKKPKARRKLQRSLSSSVVHEGQDKAAATRALGALPEADAANPRSAVRHLAIFVTNGGGGDAIVSSTNSSDVKCGLPGQKAAAATCRAAGVSGASATPAAPAHVVDGGDVLASVSSGEAAVSRSSSSPAAVLCALAAAASDTPTAAPQPPTGVMAASDPRHQSLTSVPSREATAAGSKASALAAAAAADGGGDDHLDQQQQHDASRGVAADREESGSGDGARTSKGQVSGAVLQGLTINDLPLGSAAAAGVVVRKPKARRKVEKLVLPSVAHEVHNKTAAATSPAAVPEAAAAARSADHHPASPAVNAAVDIGAGCTAQGAPARRGQKRSREAAVQLPTRSAAGASSRKVSKAEGARQDRARNLTRFGGILQQLRQATGAGWALDLPSFMGADPAALVKHASKRPDVLSKRCRYLPYDLQSGYAKDRWLSVVSNIVLFDVKHWHSLTWCAVYSMVNLAVQINSLASDGGRAILKALQIDRCMLGMQHVATCIANGLDLTTIPETVEADMQSFFKCSVLAYYILYGMYEEAMGLEFQGQTDDLEPLRALARALHADDYLTAIDLVLTSKLAVLAAYLNVVNVEKWRYKAALQLYESLDSSDHRPMELGIAARRLGFGCIESLPPIAALPEQVRCQQPVTRRALVSWTRQSVANAAALAFARVECKDIAEVIRTKEGCSVKFLRASSS